MSMPGVNDITSVYTFRRIAIRTGSDVFRALNNSHHHQLEGKMALCAHGSDRGTIRRGKLSALIGVRCGNR